MSKAVSQEDVDAVAHFVEAVQELRRSPLLIEEYRDLRLVVRDKIAPPSPEGFPSPEHVSAMLIPFRRLWQEGDPCYFRKVVKILKKANPSMASLIDSFVYSDKTAVLPFFRDAPLSPSATITIWLNTKYMHVGKSASVGKYTRQDFERYEREMGKARFEFCFLQAVCEVSRSFRNLEGYCRMFLTDCREKGLNPSFTLADATDDDSIKRETPGYPAPQDTPAHRLWRLRRRRRYDGIARFLALLEPQEKENTDNEVLSRHITKSASFDDFVSSLCLRLEQVPNAYAVTDADITNFNGTIDAYHTAVKNMKSRRGFVAKRKDGSFLWSEDYVPILRDQYVELRAALLKEPFE